MTSLDAAAEAEIARRTGLLSLREKVALLTGDSTWTTRAVPLIGLHPIVFGDGPAGVQGPDPQLPSTSLPAPTALAATWDLDLVARAGDVFANEARRAGVDVVLAPALNLQRTPVAGRHFETFSEDPVLTAQVGAGLVGAIQSWGVGACAKHFVANDSETDRTRYVARVDVSALREAYLLPFERAVTSGGAWTVMAAYNQVDDGSGAAPMTDHAGLLRGVLKDEWGFDGLVVSDWEATRSTVASARAGLDLVMPGPGGPWECELENAVRAGHVPEAVIDDKVRRILRLAARVGRLEGVEGPAGRSGVLARPRPEAGAFARELAARAMVVLRRSPSAPLPLLDGALHEGPTSVAVLGANAREPYVQGGGSAHVCAPYEVSPVEGLEAALRGSGTLVRWSRGGRTLEKAPLLAPALTVDGRGAPGVRLEVLDADRRVLSARTVGTTDWTWTRDLPDDAVEVRLSTRVRLEGEGEHVLELGAIAAHRVWIDGELVTATTEDRGVDAVLDSSVNAPPGQAVTIVVGREPRTVRVDAELTVTDAGGYGRLVSATLRHQPPGRSAEDEIADAARLAAESDVAIVVVGTNGEVESEGWDRADLTLPARQDDLVRAVLAANPRTLVVVNAGGPVELPWLEEVPTVLWAWLPGQEFGHALADVLLGRVEPAGRLPWTLPRSHDDSPVPHARPVAGIVQYAEGSLVGYRGWPVDGPAPAAPFGHGLGWTDWDYLGLEVTLTLPDGAVRLEVTVANIGTRPGREVVQAYVSGPGSGRPRLAGFGVVDLPPGGRAQVSVPIDPAALRRWDDAAGAFRTEGSTRLHVGRSSGDLRLSLDADVTTASPRGAQEGVRA